MTTASAILTVNMRERVRSWANAIIYHRVASRLYVAMHRFMSS